MLISELKSLLDAQKEPSFRFKQITSAIFTQFVTNFSDITNISLSLRDILSQKFSAPNPLKVLHTLKGDQAEKVLFETPSGHLIEAVKLSYKATSDRGAHTALCLSTQSGCAMGCTFCATGNIGFKQNLKSDEIIGQFQYFRQKGDSIDSLIFMGMGEPFANTDNLFDALRIFTDPNLIGLSPSRLSISTVGLIPGIERLIKEFPQINLTFSLHSPFDSQRSQIMPINKTFPIKDVFSSLNQYITATKNRVFIAYTLLRDFNDSPEHAYALAELIKQNPKTAYLYHVNLIRYNPCPSEVSFEKSEPEKIKAFQNILEQERISNTLRQDFGVEIDAACGQLYATYSQKK